MIVLDDNDHPPVFQQTASDNVIIAENEEVGSVVTKMEAHDGDQAFAGGMILVIIILFYIT